MMATAEETVRAVVRGRQLDDLARAAAALPSRCATCRADAAGGSHAYRGTGGCRVRHSGHGIAGGPPRRPAGSFVPPPRIEPPVALLHAAAQIEAEAAPIPAEVDRLVLNPTLQWQPLPPAGDAEPGVALLWRDRRTGRARHTITGEAELLVLKMALEGVSEEQAAEAGGMTPARVAEVVDAVADAGLVLMPPPGLHRVPDDFPPVTEATRSFVTARRFSLQWHLTNACDLRCLHCYDRTRLAALRTEQALAIVGDFVAFCRRRRVEGVFCLTGGNPLLYKGFFEVYRAIAATELPVSLMCNPTPREEIERVLEVCRPTDIQVSLEGLEEHNDRIRGRGHFQRTMEFLGMLDELRIPTGVMLTLTNDNIEQAIPLGEHLRGRTSHYTFNRLTQVGEGANLAMPTRERYVAFLHEWDEAAAQNPLLGHKDNLFNVLRHQAGEPLTNGCTGYGCGAAFNFIALLPDGEAHACRKYPSPIGNVVELGVEGVYESEAAKRYRRGTGGCSGCPLKLACGGCPGVAYGAGLDPFEDVDPHCFMAEAVAP